MKKSLVLLSILAFLGLNTQVAVAGLASAPVATKSVVKVKTKKVVKAKKVVKPAKPMVK